MLKIIFQSLLVKELNFQLLRSVSPGPFRYYSPSSSTQRNRSTSLSPLKHHSPDRLTQLDL
jgi:hypothetical protein